MTGLTSANWFGVPDAEVAEEVAEQSRPQAPRVAADWPLMSDILSHRMEMPEHLIRWRRVEDDVSDAERGARFD